MQARALSLLAAGKLKRRGFAVLRLPQKTAARAGPPYAPPRAAPGCPGARTSRTRTGGTSAAAGSWKGAARVSGGMHLERQKRELTCAPRAMGAQALAACRADAAARGGHAPAAASHVARHGCQRGRSAGQPSGLLEQRKLCSPSDEECWTPGVLRRPTFFRARGGTMVA